jgi:hypothetical protein
MANWSNPTLSSTYTNFVQECKDRDVDAATMFVSAPTNPPTSAMRYLRASNKFQEWDGAAWNDKVLSIAGGGTGGATAAAARTALGLGTLAVQNDNAVSITGGTLAGITALSLQCDIAFDADGTRSIGTFAARANKIYIANGLVIPVGTNKYVTS